MNPNVALKLKKIEEKQRLLEQRVKLYSNQLDRSIETHFAISNTSLKLLAHRPSSSPLIHPIECSKVETILTQHSNRSVLSFY